MELVAGSTLREVLRRRGRLRPDEAVSVLEPVLAALAAAHRAGLVHRDVKPENVLVSADGTVKVVDFGLARAVAAPSTSTQAGVVLGTVAYVSPEQVSRGTSDARTDVYSAGILLFELLTGAPPYGGDSALAVAYRHVHDDVPAPSTRVAGIPPALDELVLRATRREPGGRPADAGAFLAELAMVRTDLGLRRVPSREVAAALGVDAPTVPAVVRTAPTVPATGRTAPTARPLAGPHRPDRAGPARAARAGPPHSGVRAADQTPRRRAGGDPDQPGRRQRLAGRAAAQAHRSAVRARPRADARGRRRHRGLVVRHRAVRRRAAAGRPVPGAGRRAGSPTAGLSARFTGESSTTVPGGKVVRSEPGPGDRVLRGRSITVVLSTGLPPVPVPSVARKDQDEAVAEVRQAGLRPQVTEQSSVEVEEGQVVSQDPAGGTAPPGSVVRLVVSSGPAVVEVPDVRGLSIDDARQKLEAAGFEVKVRSLRIGNVIAQSPKAGADRKQGTTVTIYGL